jgi:hypothetical protein
MWLDKPNSSCVCSASRRNTRAGKLWRSSISPSLFATDPIEGLQPRKFGHSSPERRLVLEVRSRRFGFVLSEGSSILDWGARRCTDSETAARKVRGLLTFYGPGVVVARQMRRTSHQSRSVAIDVLRRIRIEVKQYGTKFILIHPKIVQNCFAGHGCRAKHEIASRLVDHFPMLRGILPKPRRPWTPEPHSTVVFDAMATYVAYKSRLSDANPTSQVAC